MLTLLADLEEMMAKLKLLKAS